MKDLDVIREKMAEIEGTNMEATDGEWQYEYDNDTGPGDEGFWEWYAICDQEGTVIARVDTEVDVIAIVDAHNTGIPYLLAALGIAVDMLVTIRDKTPEPALRIRVDQELRRMAAIAARGQEEGKNGI